MKEKTTMTITKMVFRADHLEQGSFFGGGRGEDWTEFTDLTISRRWRLDLLGPSWSSLVHVGPLWSNFLCKDSELVLASSTCRQWVTSNKYLTWSYAWLVSTLLEPNKSEWKKYWPMDVFPTFLRKYVFDGWCRLVRSEKEGGGGFDRTRPLNLHHVKENARSTHNSQTLASLFVALF